MAKRKRNELRQTNDSDYGLGTTMALLNEQDDDSGEWQTVGPRKKQRQGDVGDEHKPHRRSTERPISPRTEQYTRSSGEDTRHLPTNGSPHHSNDANKDDEGTDKIRNHSSRTFGNPPSRNGGDSEKNKSYHVHSYDKRQKPKHGNANKRNRYHDEDERTDAERSYPAIEYSHNARLQSQITIQNLQALVLYILADGHAPQWLAVRNRSSIRQVVVLHVPGLELDMFTGKINLESASSAEIKSDSGEKPIDQSSEANKDTETQHKHKHLRISPDDYYPAKLQEDRLPIALRPLSEIFTHVWPVRGFADASGKQFYRIHSPIHTMLTSPIPKSREEAQMKSDPRHKGPTPQNAKNFSGKRTPIAQYLATLAEQKENEYIVHPAWYTTPETKDMAYQERVAARQTSEYGWVDSNVTCLEDGDVPDEEIEQGSVTADRHLLTLDCEMCKAGDGTSVLTRASVLDWDGETVFDELVKPDVPIKDYLTQYSGITEAMLENVTTTLSDIQVRLLELITPRTILAGHSLNMDLIALKLTHPFLIDTGILYPHQRGPPYKQSLKWLSQKYLHKEIQKGAHGHDSIEDARACLELVKQKCEHGPAWGTGEMNAESIFKRLGRVQRPSGGGAVRAGAVVDWGEPIRGHGSQATVAIGCQSDADVVEGIKLAVNGLAVGKSGAIEKLDFVWGRLRELELLRGWWDDAKTADVRLLRSKALERLGRFSEEGEKDEVTGSSLGDVVARTVDYVKQVHSALPPGTAFIVYSGNSDPREMRRLQAMREQYRREYQTKKWDELSVKWTDTEIQALSQACKQAREGIGFVVVK